jgi:hypothetical protein
MNYKRDLPFSIVPVEVAFDSRLTSRHMRVLIALLSFRNRETGLICPSRSRIASRCGLPVGRVSTVTTELVDLHWLKKVGNGGRSSSCQYVFTVPSCVSDLLFDLENNQETVTNPVTVTDMETVTDPVTKTVTKMVTKTVTNLVTGKEQTMEQTNKQIKEKYKKEKMSEVEVLSGFGIVDPVLVDDFVQHRKQHKGAITVTALQGLQREGNKAGMSLADVLRECIERNWRGFKAEWLTNNGGKHANSIGNTRKLSLVEQYDIDVERVQQREQRERERFTVVA